MFKTNHNSKKQVSAQTMARKQFLDLEFQDAFMFAAVMEDEELCRKILERILDFPIEKVIVRTEMSLFINSDYHGIRMDVYARDEDGTVFNVEMQMTPQETEVIAKRSRYYQSQLDITLLKPGESYRMLPNSYVIFICASFDPFGKSYYRYTFREQCQESGELLQDGTTKIFLNCKGTNNDKVPRELIDFLHYVEQASYLRGVSDPLLSEDELLAEVETRMKEIKWNRGWEARYMQFQEMLAEERRDGFAKGLEAGLAKGLETGHAEMLTLIAAMTADKRLEEVPRLSEPKFLQEMLEHYGLI